MDGATITAEPASDPRNSRRVWAIAGAVILGLLLVAFIVWRLVGGGDLQRLAGAPDATIAAGTARVAVVATVEDVPIVERFTLTVAEGEAELAEQRAHLRREMPGLGNIPLLNRLLPEAVELLHDGRDTYVRLPVDGQRSWVRLSEAENDAAAGPGTTAPGLTNPVAALALLHVLDGMPEVRGQETVRGQPSTRFRVLVDLDRAVDALSGRARDVAVALRQLRGSNRLPMDVWLDADDRVTRLRYMVRPELRGVGPITVTSDLELYDFGTDVDIRTPSPAEIVQVPADRLRGLDLLDWLRDLLDR
ncbi:MAG TPA: hypothetical protein VM287_15935 [Egibacteraceae bacterium]|nr:hypothetical protein [Egibacteraceae bacterium]